MRSQLFIINWPTLTAIIRRRWRIKPTTKIIVISAFLAFCSTSLADLGDPNLLEAQLLALEVSGQLRPPEDLTELILNDLAAIRAAFPDVADIHYRMPFAPDEIIVGITQEAAEQFRNGEFHALDELNTLYGVIEIRTHFHPSYSVLILKFNQIYNTQLLSQVYTEANLEGVLYAEPNYSIGDGSTISADLPFYTFIRKWGCDGFGCYFSESYLFRVEDGRVTACRDKYYVDAIDGDDDNDGLSPNTAFATIQKAIDTAYASAYAGDVVIVAPGIYTGLGNRDIDFISRTITVRSIDPNDPNIVASTIIDCNGTEAEPHRGFYFHNGKSVNCVVAGFSIRNGYANYGGGIYCDESNPTIASCAITDNSARYGGGICCEESKPVITGCTIIGNSAKDGGGLYACEGPVSNCTITGNSAMDGGGLHKCTGPVTSCDISNNLAKYGGGGLRFCKGPITNCTISGNSADEGGGLCLCTGPVTNCIITGNSAVRYSGGAMFLCEGPITNCTISGNSASDGGGLAECDGPVTNCTITGNSATYGGGLYACFDPITNCTITGNSATYGGGLYACDDPITNCTITGNSATYGGGMYACIDSITNCIIWDNWPEQVYDCSKVTYSNVQGGCPGLGNIDADPCFIEPGYWVDANDPNIIVEPNDPNAVWLDGDYHLLTISPCINTGDPNYVPEPSETDLDGNPRVNGGRIDMGAYESVMHEARLWIWPSVINRESHWPRTITAWLHLPRGITKDQINKDVPLILYPGSIKAIRQFVIQKRGRCAKPTSVFAFFNKAELMDAIDTNGPVQLQVLGHLLKPGQYFYGYDTIRIIAPRPPRRPPHHRH